MIHRYKTVSDFMAEFRLLVTNAEQYNSTSHPVTDAARKVQEIAQTEVTSLKHHLAKDGEKPDARQKIFACPSCQIAICASCRKVGHEGECNHAVDDQETAMLQSYGYKRCPRCRHGVKKMYGCPHINCLCGAHFCYNCLRSIDECPGGCGFETDVEEEEEARLEEERAVREEDESIAREEEGRIAREDEDLSARVRQDSGSGPSSIPQPSTTTQDLSLIHI